MAASRDLDLQSSVKKFTSNSPNIINQIFGVKIEAACVYIFKWCFDWIYHTSRELKQAFQRQRFEQSNKQRQIPNLSKKYTKSLKHWL